MSASALRLEPMGLPTRFGRARGIAGDILLATAVIWALPLAIAAVYFVGRMLFDVF